MHQSSQKQAKQSKLKLNLISNQITINCNHSSKPTNLPTLNQPAMATYNNKIYLGVPPWFHFWDSSLFFLNVKVAASPTIQRYSQHCTTPNGRRAQPKVLRFSLKEPWSALFRHTQLLLQTVKHPKTFVFPSHTFSSSSPSTPPNGRPPQQSFLLFSCNETRSTQRFLLWFSNTSPKPPSYFLLFPCNQEPGTQRFVFNFLNPKHEALKGSYFDFQIQTPNHLRISCFFLATKNQALKG